MTLHETKAQRAKRQATARAEKRRERYNAKQEVKKFIGNVTLMSKIIWLADQGEDVKDLVEEWLEG